jgi:Trypsin/Putative metal-binding motif
VQKQNPRLLVLSLALLVLGSVSASAELNKVTVCHVTGSGNVHALSVSESAVPAHQEHGDFLPGNFYADADGDGFGDPATGIPACNAPEGYVDNGDDCDDTDIDVSPNATEVPGDGVDNDCNPATPDVVIACGGGHEVNVANYPYQVSIQRLVAGVYVHQCGGALIRGRKVVTAASCVSEGDAIDYRVGVGSSKLSTMTNVTLVAARAIHPDYTGTDAGLELNVAVLRLASNVPTSATVGYIAMATASAGTFAGQNALVSGWGDTANAPQIVNDDLQGETALVLTNTECSALVNGRPITDGHLCVDNPALDACTGDVGGPVRGGNALIGIQSWPVDLTVPYSSASSVPRVATRVSTVRAWIDSQ